MQKLYKIKVDISKKYAMPAFEVNTNDLKSIRLSIEVLNGTSPLDLSDKTVRIAIRKPDNNIVFQDCEIIDAATGQVEVILENQAYITPGTHTAEIMCYKGSDVVAVSGTFSYKSVKGIMNDEAVESKSEFTAINRTLNEAERILEDLRENGGGAGVDQQARQKIEEVTTQLADTVKENSILRPVSVKTKQKKQKPIVSFIDDDGDKSVFSMFKPIADEKGIKFNACVYAEPLIQKQPYMMTPAQLLQLQSEGHEILSHGWKKDLQITLANPSEYHREFGESKMYLKSLGLDVNSFVWQGGAYNQEALNVIPHYYDSAWAIDEPYGINKKNDTPLEQYKGHRFSLDNATLATAKAEVDSLVANGGWLVFMSHCWDTQWKTPQKQQDLRDIIDYIKSKTIDIVTIKEGLEIHGNIFDYGRTDLGNDYFKVDKQGTVLNKGNRFYSQPNNTVTPSTPPSFFKENSMNITYHDGSTPVTGFPESKMGTLITEKGLSSITIQYWHPYKNNNDKTTFYVRTNDNANNGGLWNDWIKRSFKDFVVDLGYDAVTPTDRSRVVAKAINKTQITNSPQGFPENKQGTYTTDFYTDNGYAKEEYEIRNTTTKYRRSQKSDGTFTDWVQYAFVKKKGYTMVMPTLGANSSGTVTLDISDLALSGDYYLSVGIGDGGFPSGVIWSCVTGSTSIKFTFFNATSSQITGTTIYPKIVAFPA